LKQDSDIFCQSKQLQTAMVRSSVRFVLILLKKLFGYVPIPEFHSFVFNAVVLLLQASSGTKSFPEYKGKESTSLML
jgi:hypothetical protein